MNLQEILNIKECDVCNEKHTEFTKKLGVSGVVISRFLDENGFKYNNLTGEVFLNGQIVKKVNVNGSNMTRLKMLYVFIAEVKEVLRVIADPYLKRASETNYEESIEIELGLDGLSDDLVFDINTKTYSQIEDQVRDYFEKVAV